jgi:hypothetical protein
LRKGLLAGCVMASFTVEDFGFRRLSELTKADVNARHAEFTAMLAFGD